MDKQLTDLITYSVTDAELAKLSRDYMSLGVLNWQDNVNYELCNKARKDVKRLRVDIEKRRKELKADSLEFGRLVDGEAKRITAKLEAIEIHLRQQLDVRDGELKRRQEEQARAERERLNQRIAMLAECQALYDPMRIGAMSDDEFSVFYDGVLKEYKERLARRIAEQERLAQLERQAEEQAAKIAEQEAEATRLREELLAKQRIELAEKQAEINAAAERESQSRIEKEILAEELAKERLRQEAEAHAALESARKLVKNQQILNDIRDSFPTLETAWAEIARLWSVYGITNQAE